MLSLEDIISAKRVDESVSDENNTKVKGVK